MISTGAQKIDKPDQPKPMQNNPNWSNLMFNFFIYMSVNVNIYIKIEKISYMRYVYDFKK